MSAPSPWSIVIGLETDDPRRCEWIARSLGPEASREVPRTRGAVRPIAPTRLEVKVEARDTGAARAATNAYLGWLALIWATLERADPATPSARAADGTP
ncbi:MAG: KEOPS complex subunit Pcc1 [Thermoplasmata archaeon]